MTDKDVFKAYCKRQNINVSYWTEYKDILTSTYSYKLFKLQIAIDELKQSIKDTLFFWRK